MAKQVCKHMTTVGSYWLLMCQSNYGEHAYADLQPEQNRVVTVICGVCLRLPVSVEHLAAIRLVDVYIPALFNASDVAQQLTIISRLHTLQGTFGALHMLTCTP